MLTKSNYHEWSLLMKVKLQARQLWEAVHVGGVGYKPTAKMAWDAIALRQIGGERVHRATLQQLRGEWEGLTF
jgi:hypothetical protein